MAAENALVTVMIPAWNAEKTLERTVRSVLSQTHRRLRLLVIDDGSTDATAALLARLSEEDARLRSITVPNGGPAAARNRGLELLGEDCDYLMFLDADDLLLPDAIDCALRGAQGAELTVFGFSILGTDGSRRDYCEPEQHLDRAALGAELGRLYKANLLNQVWGKLYSASLLRREGLRFPDYRWGEDRLFVFSVLEKATRVSILPDCKYQYIMSEGESLITRYYERKFAVCCEIDRRAGALCASLGVKDDADFRYMFAKSVFSCLTTLYAPSCPLDRAGKRAAAREIAENPQVRARLKNAPGGLAVRLLSAALLSGSPGLSLLCARGLVFLSKCAPGLVMRVKHRK